MASAMPLIIILFILAAIVAVVLQAHAQNKREKLVRAWAHINKYEFVPGRDPRAIHRFDLDCLEQGLGRYAYNRVRGMMGDAPFEAFDYHYETTSTDSKGNTQTHHHHFSAAIIEAPARLKPLFIRKEGFFDRVSRAVGFDDIDFESAEFSDTFFVKAKDRKWAYDVVSQRTMELLLKMPHYRIEISGPHIAVYRSKRFKPEEFGTAVYLAKQILEGIPKDVIASLRT